MNKHIKEKKKILIQTMGSSMFNSIRDFFQAIEYGDSQFNIYISKKCYALFLVFEPFLELDDNKVRCTDIRIPLLEEQMRKKKVTLVDDILIHGRTLNTIKRKLQEMECQIEICALALNEEAKIIDEGKASGEVLINLRELSNTACETKQFYNCNSYLWKKISDLIMRCFWATNMPYSADLPVIELASQGVEILKENRDKYERYICENHSNGKMGMVIEYLFPNSVWKQDIIESDCCFCILLQKSSRINSFKMLPMLFLNEDAYNKKNVIENIYKYIYGESVKDVLEQLRFDEFGENEDVTVTNIKFMTYSLSRLLLQRFVDEMHISEKYYRYDNRNLEFSFGKSFEKFYNNIKKENNFKIDTRIRSKLETVQADKRVDVYRYFVDELKKYIRSGKPQNKADFTRMNSVNVRQQLMSKLQGAVDDVDKLYKRNENYSNQKRASYMYARFLKANSILDDNELYQNKNRLLGLKVQEMLQVVKERTDLDYKEVMVGFLSQFYLGASTMVVGKENDVYNLYCHAGEQSYKCIVHEFVPLVYFNYRYRYEFLDDVAELMNDCFLKMAIANYRYFKVPFDKEDYEKYSLNYSENIYDIYTLKEHCKEDSSRILCRIGFLLDDYVSTAQKLEKSEKTILEGFRKYLIKFSKEMEGEDKKHIIGALRMLE